MPTRREFLVSLSTLGAGLALNLKFGHCADAQTILPVEEFFANPGSVRSLGLQALRRLPRRGQTAAELIADVFPELHNAAQPPSADKLRGTLRTKMAADFAAERTVAVNGWIVSLTEARLWAAVALLLTLQKQSTVVTQSGAGSSSIGAAGD